MKILQLTKKFPYPLKDGEAIAITYLARALDHLDCEVTLLSMNTTKHFFDICQLPSDFNHYQSIHLAKVDNRVKIVDAFLNLFSTESYHIARFVSKAFEHKLIELLQQNNFDVVQLETLYLAPYVDVIRKYSKAKIVMRSHNVEHEIWKRITQNTAAGAKKAYLQLLTKRLESFEIERLNSYDMMVAITQRDLDFFERCGCKVKKGVTPIGLELKDYKPNLEAPPTFCFIGSLDWMPNTEGIDWILKYVWPKVLKACPEAQFHIAGRHTPTHLLQQTWKNVSIHGEVPDAMQFINQHGIMLVPLFSGSGMRVKILEGMALGKVVISTTLGLEGIAAQNNKEVLIADEDDEFANAMIRCLQEPQKLNSIGRQAIEFIKNNFDNIQITKKLLEAYQSMID